MPVKGNRSRRRQRQFPVQPPDDPAATAVEAVRDERQDSNRVGFKYAAAAAFFVLLGSAAFALGYRLAADITLLAGWFCGSMALAWWITAAAHRLPFFARGVNRLRHLPARFRVSSVLAAVLWFFIFHGGGIVLIRYFDL
jgi:hypothetical protein